MSLGWWARALGRAGRWARATRWEEEREISLSLSFIQPMTRLLCRFLQYGPVFKLVFGPKAFVVVSDPVVARHLLKVRWGNGAGASSVWQAWRTQAGGRSHCESPREWHGILGMAYWHTHPHLFLSFHLFSTRAAEVRVPRQQGRSWPSAGYCLHLPFTFFLALFPPPHFRRTPLTTTRACWLRSWSPSWARA